MNKCKMCGTIIPDGTEECPNCQFKISSSKKINRFTNGIKGYYIFVPVVVLLIFGFVIFQFINIGNMNPTSMMNEKEEYAKNIVLLDGAKITNDNFYYIEGTLKNNNNKDINGVKVTFTTYDKEGSLLDTYYAIATLIEANGTWKFKVNCGFSEFDNFKLKDIEVL